MMYIFIIISCQILKILYLSAQEVFFGVEDKKLLTPLRGISSPFSRKGSSNILKDNRNEA
ncbi:hypothetical protein SPI02_10470 [Staphylococcus piscifermentans]|uniref:Uncharacterized protein n=1 Tax=Staphylococcus piscifermentans TaxID=70258 RepID=A0A512QLZ4_9STAP|nr:hypothetical protein SPI02_10470 [Staphylococcus piscifermentans]